MSYSVSGNKITLTRGDTFRATVSIFNPDGTPYELQEGDSVRFAMKQDYDDEEVLILKDIPTDTMELVLEPEDTKPYEFGDYVYDIQLTKANGDVDTFVAKAKIKLTEEVE